MRSAILLAFTLAACSEPMFDVDQLDLLAAMTPVQPPPADPTNAVADDPNAAALGRALFFSPALSESGSFSCATCHDPELEFADASPVSTAAGTTDRHAPSIINSAYNRWQFWDGRCDSQWCQALGPIEAPNEMAGTRLGVAHAIYDDPELRAAYEGLFGPMPALNDPRFPDQGRPVTNDLSHPHALAWAQLSATDQADITEVFVNIGKAIAAYERLLVTGEGPLDDYVQGLIGGDRTYRDALSPEAERGLQLFVGEGQCHFCHTGPQLTNGEFHNIGLEVPEGLPAGDQGRFTGVTALRASEFNALGPYSDDTEGAAAERLTYLSRTADSRGQFKVPSLRRVARSGPYMRGGQFDDLDAVMQYYNDLDQTPEFGHIDETLTPLELPDEDLQALVIFMEEALHAELVDPTVASAP